MARLKWTVEFSVDSFWVADGFDLTDERAKEMLANDLGYAYGYELGAKVVKYPSAEKVARLQGYYADGPGADGASGLKAGIARIERERKEGKL